MTSRHSWAIDCGGMVQAESPTHVTPFRFVQFFTNNNTRLKGAILGPPHSASEWYDERDRYFVGAKPVFGNFQ